MRFPFSAKKSFREDGLRARLDESPERDVDIVTGAKATQQKVEYQQQVAAQATATGDAQRVLHVDNTAAAGGDGSKERPFNTLKAAEAAMRAHDAVYVHRGDGTTTGQDQGIVIDKVGISLIGSGTKFVYDAGRFTAASGAGYSGVLLATKGRCAVITNVAGGGVSIEADRTHVSGFEV